MQKMSDHENYSRYWNAHLQVSNLNFATCRHKITMLDLDKSPESMDWGLQHFLHNMALLDAGESLARYQVRNPYDLFASSLEARLRTVLDPNGPYVKPPADMDQENAFSLNWADVVREVKLHDFHQSADGSHCCLFKNEHFIIISERDFETLSTLQPFLQPWPPWPHPDDVDKERMVLAMELEKVSRFKETHTESKFPTPADVVCLHTGTDFDSWRSSRQLCGQAEGT